ncbi:unnamed protein product [Rhizophagus irregularis]|nr:unnamed protein product [Rhizophagus irregularis]
MPTKKETRQKKNPVLLHFIEGQFLNSSQYKKKNKRSRVEAELNDDDNDENATHHNMQKTMDKSIPSNEMTAIHQQILRALLSANVPFSFVDTLKLSSCLK